jgi:uncharacterized protein YjbI with pentapeptide repeats
MANGLKQVSKRKTCDNELCSRQARDESNYCKWHIEEDGKVAEDMLTENHTPKVRDAYLKEADFSNTDLSGAKLPGADFRNADLISTNLSATTLTNTNFNKANLSGANLSNSNMSESTLRQSKLSNAQLKNTDLSNSVLSQTELFKVDLTGVNLTGAEISQIDDIELIVSALTSSDDLIRGAGVDAATELIHQDPTEYPELAYPLLQAFIYVDIPSVRITAIRGLATLSAETEVSLKEGDSDFAHLLKYGDPNVKEEIILNLSTCITNNPDDFPDTIEVLEKVLGEQNIQTQLAIVKILAIIAHNFPKKINNYESLLTSIKSFTFGSETKMEEVNKAIEVIRLSRFEQA